MTTAAQLLVRVGADISQAQRGLQQVDQRLKLTQQNAQAMGRVFLAAGAVVAGGLGLSVKAAGDFEATLSGVGAVSGATKAQLADLGNVAMKIGPQFGDSANQAASGMEELSKAGVSLPDIMNGAAKATLTLAAAGGVSLPEAADIASNAMNSFGLSGKDMAHVADLVAGAANASSIDVSDFGLSLSQAGAVARAAGLSIDDTSVAIAELGQNGIKGSDAGTSLRTMLLRLNPVTKQAQDEMRQLGIITADGTNQFYTASGSVKSFAQIQQVLQTATAGLTDAQRQQALQIIFGTDAIRSATIFAREGADGFNQMAFAMSKVSAADVAAARLDNLNGSMLKFRAVASNDAIMIGSILSPALRTAADDATTLANDFANLPPTMQRIIAVGGTGFAALALSIGATTLAAGTLVGAVKNVIGVFAKKQAAKEALTAANAGLQASMGATAAAADGVAASSAGAGVALTETGTAATGLVATLLTAAGALAVVGFGVNMAAGAYGQLKAQIDAANAAGVRSKIGLANNLMDLFGGPKHRAALDVGAKTLAASQSRAALEASSTVGFGAVTQSQAAAGAAQAAAAANRAAQTQSQLMAQQAQQAASLLGGTDAWVQATAAEDPAARAAAASVNALTGQVSNLQMAQDANTAATRTAQDALSAMQERVSTLSDSLSQAKQRLQDLSNVKLVGMGAEDQKEFDLTQQINANKLQQLKLEQRIAAEKQKPAPRVPGITVGVPQNGGKSPAERQLDAVQAAGNALQNRLEQSRLAAGLKFDPQLRKLQKDAQGTNKELTFAQAEKGIKDAKQQINDLTTQLASAKDAAKAQQDRIKGLEDASQGYASQLKRTQDQLQTAQEHQAKVNDVLQATTQYLLVNRVQLRAQGPAGVAAADQVDKATTSLLDNFKQYVNDSSQASNDMLDKLLTKYKNVESEQAAVLLGLKKIATGNVSSTPAGRGAEYGGLAPGRAAGGPVRAGHLYLVGEHGPESFVPGANGMIMPHGALGSGTAASATTINVNAPLVGQVTVTGAADEDRLVGKIHDMLHGGFANAQRQGTKRPLGLTRAG